MNSESKDARLIPLYALLRNKSGVDLEQDIMEGSAEVSAVDGGVARGFWIVDVFAFGAVEFCGFGCGDVGETHWEERVRATCYARAFAKVAFLVFLELFELAYCAADED